MNSKIKFLSLFSGCGGFDYGFENVGYECIGAIDNDPAVLDVYNRNLSGKTYLYDLSSHELPDEIKGAKIDVLVTGSPCQGFSTAGQRNLDDPRNKLLLVSGSIAKQLNPQVIISENVMGSLSGAHKMYWDTLISNLRELGYHIDLLQLAATNFGLAQLRKRVFLVAWKGKKDIDFKLSPVQSKTLKDVLINVEGLPNQDLFVPITDHEVKKIIKHVKPGQKICNVRGGSNSVHTWNIPEVFGTVTDEEKKILNLIKDLRRKIRIRKTGDADPLLLKDIQQYFSYDIKSNIISLVKKNFVRKIGDRFDLVHTYNGLYKRVSWDKSSMTVDTRFGTPRYFLHPSEDRGFTVREAARIQGFDDSFVFHGTTQQQFKMIGNAVPPPMAQAIAEIVKSKIFYAR